MITFALCVLITGAILYGLAVIGLTIIGGIMGLFAAIKAPRKQPPVEITDWFREKYLSNS